MDGCRGGWVIARLRVGPGLEPREPTFRMIAHLDELAPRPDARRLFVDMPMGLSEGQHREVEARARAALPPGRKSSVFPVPCRQAVYVDGYAACCAVNERYLGIRVSKQSFNIAVKIRELDGMLAQRRRWRARVFESHPEICFARLARGPLSSKRSKAGASQRGNIIEAYLPGARSSVMRILGETRRRDVAIDDLLDALVLALCAAMPTERLEQIPARADIDPRGIPMRLVVPREGGDSPVAGDFTSREASG